MAELNVSTIHCQASATGVDVAVQPGLDPTRRTGHVTIAGVHVEPSAVLRGAFPLARQIRQEHLPRLVFHARPFGDRLLQRSRSFVRAGSILHSPSLGETW